MVCMRKLSWVVIVVLGGCGSGVSGPVDDQRGTPAVADDDAPVQQGDESGAGGDEGPPVDPLIAATLTATTELVIGELLTLTFTIDQASEHDVSFEWQVASVTSEYPAEYAALSDARWGGELAELRIERRATILAGQTSATVTVQTGTAGLARQMTLHVMADSSDAQLASRDLDITVKPRPTDVRSLTTCQTGDYRLLENGTVLFGNNFAEPSWPVPGLPPLRLFEVAGGTVFFGVTMSNQVVSGTHYQNGRTPNTPVVLALHPSFDARDVVAMNAGYYSAAMSMASGAVFKVRLNYPAITQEVTNTDDVVSFDQSWNSPMATYAKADGSAVRYNTSGEVVTLFTVPDAIQIATPHSTIYVLTSSGALSRHDCNYDVCQAPKVATGLARMDHVTSLLAGIYGAWITFDDQTALKVVSKVESGPVTPDAMPVGPFAGAVLQYSMSYSKLCALVVGNTIECL